MAITCLPSETHYDVQCPVCGRGFLLLSEPTLDPDKTSLRHTVRETLAAQHGEGRYLSPDRAHPGEAFDLPQWDSSTQRAPGRRMPVLVMGLA